MHVKFHEIQDGSAQLYMFVPDVPFNQPFVIGFQVVEHITCMDS